MTRTTTIACCLVLSVLGITGPTSVQARALVAQSATTAHEPRTELRLDLVPKSGMARGLYANDPVVPGQVSLTFDDGPHPTATKRVLDLLAQHHLNATFFVVGRNINDRTYPLIQRMVLEGHEIGSHSYNHDIDMAMRHNSEATVQYVRGQFETTQILVDLAILARSPEHFRAMFQSVFQEPSDTYLSSNALRERWPQYVSRHASLLEEQGVEATHAYPISFSRPPGGGPFLGYPHLWSKQLYSEAISQAGLLNIMWHGASGDTDPVQRHDPAALLSNFERSARKGGVLLLHDFMRTDALAEGFRRISANPRIHVVPLRLQVERKLAIEGNGALRLGAN